MGQKKMGDPEEILSTIDIQYMNEMITAYMDRIHPLLTMLKNGRYSRTEIDHSLQDARSAWLSFTELEKFIKANPDANGLRIYYGIHTRDCIPTNGRNQKGMHNIIFVPTKSVDGALPTYQNSLNTVSVTHAIEKSDIDESYGTLLIGGMGKVKIDKIVSFLNPEDTFPLCPPNCP
ncbi:MAG: hypothetical protein H7Y86_10745 [Rhizobacter sp.]|nr:hypothetical protein [Ferruginibacter sp.]